MLDERGVHSYTILSFSKVVVLGRDQGCLTNKHFIHSDLDWSFYYYYFPLRAKSMLQINNLGFLLVVKGPVHPKYYVWIRLAIEITG